MSYNFTTENNVVTISNKPSSKGRFIGFLLLTLSLVWLAYILWQFWFPVFDRKNAGVAFYPVLFIVLTVFFCFNYKTIFFDLKSESIIIVRRLILLKTTYLKSSEAVGLKSVINHQYYDGHYRQREHITVNYSLTSYLVLNSGAEIKMFQIHGRFHEQYNQHLKMVIKRTGLCLLDG
ncbi:hypothetical protein GCM10023151_03220 [Kangiella marina]|uniref:DUF304 domain-containing protein n=1 Tax=Kangiella marina TaxID=1079178 RepID=A0ABP8IC45_9GAMM